MDTEVIPFIHAPVTVIRGKQLASLFAHGEDILLPELSHFIPMEAPEAVTEQVDALDTRVRAQEDGSERGL